MDEFLEQDPMPNDDIDRRTDRSRAGEWIWYGVLSLFLLLVTVAGVSMAAAVSPRFCAMCHQQATGNLASNAHKDQACDSCHRDAGALGLVENRLWIAGMVMEAPVRAIFPSGAQANVDRDRCIQCHKGQMAVTSEKNGVVMNHAALVKENWSCQRCHRDIAHGKDGQTVAIYTMGTCLGCHGTSAKDINSCSTCHAEDAKPSANRLVPTTFAVTHGANWQKTHGMGDLATCNACHAKDYCIGCHKVSLPHPPTFMKEHGAEMASVGKDACMTCHQSTSCDSCHGGIAMPHPADFTKEHKSLVKESGKASCMRCHDEVSCDNCHTRHTHPGLSPERLKELNERPVNVQ